MIYKLSIIVYLNPILAKKVRKLQKNLFKVIGSQASFKLWKSHLTIGSGVKISEKELKGLYKDIKVAISYIKPFKISIRDYDFMDDWAGGELREYTQYVIYLKVISNKKI